MSAVYLQASERLGAHALEDDMGSISPAAHVRPAYLDPVPKTWLPIKRNPKCCQPWEQLSRGEREASGGLGK